MTHRRLGQSDLMVSPLCLGSMTWGSQNSAAEGHAQIDRALEAGINFIDTAEMYPVNPIRAETQGRTEEILGTWFAQSGRREEVILATKVSGAGAAGSRGGEPITGNAMRRAVDASLGRLRTDRIDLYQLHWPNRGSYHFRKYWRYDPAGESRASINANIRDVLETAASLIAEGKIRHLGLSNESAWGTAQFLRIADSDGLPRVVSIQNEYSLLCRIFDLDLAELCHHEGVSLLPFSPLAAGILSGKYQGDATPAGSRRSINANLGGRITPRLEPAVQAYLDIAERHGLDPCQMALAWTLTRPATASTIFGATSLTQLETLLPAADLTLSEEILVEIQAAHKAHPMPF
ncbi:MAG: aldo/keto reductase [Pseudomonadota bacterium]